MPNKLSPPLVATLFTEYVESKGADSQLKRLISEFSPIIQIMAARYRDPTWRLDLVQEGNVGLLNAIRKFPPLGDRNKFMGYAIKAIKNTMIDFVRKTLKKNSATLFVSTYSTDPPQTVDHFENCLTPFDYYTSCSWPVTVTYHLDRSSSPQIGLTKREIRIWDLYLQGYKHFEIAQIIQLSSSQTSKEISKIKTKMQTLYK
jgi:DNA-directed RNA polymerase specialized sigma subunit